MRKASVLLLAVILSGLAWAADVNSDFGLEEASAPPQTTIVGSPKALTWVDRTAINQGTSRLAAAAVNGKVYYFGGQSATTPVHLGVTGEYDPIANTWTARDTMPARASNITCAVWNNKVYVPGGYTDGPVYLDNLQVFDPTTGTWTQQTAMPVALGGAACAVVRDTLYVMGGYNGSAYINTVYAYDLVAQTWSTKAPMAYARAYFGAAAVGGKIYAVGGFDGANLSYIEEYDPATNSWTTKAAMPTARGGVGITAFGGKVYAVGGGWTTYLNTIDVYDPATDTWSTETPMLHGCRTMGVTSMGNDIYVVGGWAGAFLNYNQLGGQAPQAVWSLPVDGSSGAHVNPEVKIAFSEPMAQASFGYACNPSLGAVNGLFWNAAGDTLTISLVNNKAYSTAYALDYWATDLSGLNLAAGPVSNPITFTTWDAPEVIYSQMDAPGSAYVSQIFYDYPSYSSYMADDINLSGFDSVVVRAVELVGGGWNGHNWHPMDSLYLGFTTDSTNLPAWSQAIYQANLQPGTFDDVVWGDGLNHNTFIMYLNPPVTLHNGKSWMTSAPYMGFDTKNGQWGWAVNDPAVIYGSAPAWRNPDGGFGYGTDWQRASVLGMTGDGVFRLLGNTYRSPYWVSHTDMNVGGYGHAVAGWKGRVYAFGGSGGGSNPVNTIRYYDTLAGTWTTTSTVLPQALYFASAATVGDKIYIIGGSNAWPTPLSTVYCYSPDGDSISTRASLPVATMEHACGVWKGTHIYVMGGGNWGMTPINNVQVYNIAADTWSAATAMPAARGCLGGAVCGNYAVAACGNSSNFNAAAECYVGTINPSDPTSITWTTGTSYPGGGRIRPSTMAYDNKLFLSSGWNTSIFGTTHNYDPATDTWTAMPDKTTPTVSAGQAALVGRWAYVVGGEAGSQNESLFLGGGTGIVGGPTAPVSPAMLSLEPNFPNPVRGRTNISFNLPQAGAYELRVFNIAGQMVDRMAGQGQAGPNRLTWNAGRLAAGVYLYSVSSNGQSATQKLVVIK
jgi:N-acetylneuraminic acid mutarotase